MNYKSIGRVFANAWWFANSAALHAEWLFSATLSPFLIIFITVRLDFSLKSNKSSPNYYTFYLVVFFCCCLLFIAQFYNSKQIRLGGGGVRPQPSRVHAKIIPNTKWLFSISKPMVKTAYERKKQFITFYKIMFFFVCVVRVKMCRAGKIVNCNKLTHLQMNLHTIFDIVGVAAMRGRVFDFDVYLNWSMPSVLHTFSRINHMNYMQTLLNTLTYKSLVRIFFIRGVRSRIDRFAQQLH